ncbi:MAG: hypothetical protein IK080_05930 [Clostridia bacterium]|nr:hypothetical protein [Clostridia bacterium]
MEDRKSRVEAIVCPQCGAKLTIDENQNQTICEYCDAVFSNADLLGESDVVRMERMRQKTEQERMKQELTIAEKEEEQAQISQFKKSKLSKVVLVFAVFAVVGCISSFGEGSIVSGFMMIPSAAMFFCSWLSGMHIIDLKIRSAHVICMVAGLVFLLVGVSMI